MDWNYFDRFESTINKYMPDRGEGDTVASQIATAVNKLVYKWYNDGDVYDNRYVLKGWCNDLSSYANWLVENADAKPILDKIRDIDDFDIHDSYRQYELILKELADKYLDEGYLASRSEEAKVGSIYECDGPFMFDEEEEYEEEEYYEDVEED